MMRENKRLFGKGEISQHFFKKSLVRIFEKAEVGFQITKGMLSIQSKLSDPTVRKYLAMDDVKEVLENLNVQVVGTKLVKVDSDGFEQAENQG